MSEMPEIPDAWPADDDAGTDGRVVPIFPLSNVWLVPNAVFPLHVFEARYRKLVDDVIDRAGDFVLGTVVDGHESDMPDAPPVYPMAGLGTIHRYEHLPDGRYLIMLAGRERVFVEEVESDEPYRKVRIRSIDETPAPDHLEGALREELTSAILDRTEELMNLPEDLPVGCLADLLTLRVNPEHAQWHAIYTELDVERRVQLALAAHKQDRAGEDPTL
ncbi:MAG: LON peptidase substrate-binding domain-containing protein [Planctomycetota bacterium]|jgi:Lon protease-like protein